MPGVIGVVVVFCDIDGSCFFVSCALIFDSFNVVIIIVGVNIVSIC